MKPISQADILPKTRVFVRCDLDVPVKDGKVEDAFRLDAAVPTLKLIIDKGGMPIIAGHLDRPGGKSDEEHTTAHLRSYFDSKLGAEKYELLENLRFDPREEENSEEFAKELIEKTRTEIYVNDAFANSHRPHTSMITLPKLLPAFAGLHLLEEVKVLGGLLENPERPFISIIGGAKLETKLPAIKKLSNVCDHVLVGGKMGLEWTGELPENVHLPADYIEDCDIGKETMNQFADILVEAKTIVWAGPMGKFEDDRYVTGTHLLADEVIGSGAYTVVGGGDTIAALRKIELLDLFGFVSVGGGAMLDFLEKDGVLPALKVLQ